MGRCAGRGPGFVDADGNATFTVSHQYAVVTDVTANVKITDLFGGIGVDFTEIRQCGDPAEFSAIDPNGDLYVCGVQNSGTAFTMQLQVAPGGVISDDFQYRLHLDIGVGKNGVPVPDGSDDLTLKYNNGSVTGVGGLPSLTATQIDNQTIQFEFDHLKLPVFGNQQPRRATLRFVSK